MFISKYNTKCFKIKLIYYESYVKVNTTQAVKSYCLLLVHDTYANEC